MRGIWYIVGGLAIVVAVGAGIVYFMKRQLPQKPAPKQVVELPAGAEVRLSGTIGAVNLVQVAAPLDGVAEEFTVKAGDEVYEGQLLGRIANDQLKETEHEAALQLDRAKERVTTLDSELIALRLEESRATADASRAGLEMGRAERVYQRQQLLHKEGATPRNVFLKAEEEFKAAKQESETLRAMAVAAQEKVQKLGRDVEAARKVAAEREETHDLAKQSLAAADVLAPCDGVVVAVRKGNGDEVEKGMPNLFEIARDLGQLRILAEAAPAIAKRIGVGDAALVVTPEVPGEGIPGQVKSVEGDRIVVEFASPTPLIRPGATATVRLKVK